MRFLLDACIWGPAATELQAAGHDAVWSGSLGEDPGDDAILGIAHRDQRILVTLDKDFGELAVHRNKPHQGIIRLVGIGARRQGAATSEVAERYASDLSRGAIVTVEPGRVRVRLLRAPE